MKDLLAYFEIWQKRGRADTGAPSRKAGGFAEQAALTLFCGGMISEYDLQVGRMLYDKVYSENAGADQGLHLFLVMMAASLNQGNVYLPARPENLAAEYETLLNQATALAAGDGERENSDIDMRDAGARSARSAQCMRFAREFQDAFDKGIYSAVIGPLHKPVVRYNEYWFFQKYFHAYTSVSSLFAERLGDTGETPFAEDAVRNELALVLKGTSLHQLQKIAVALGCLKRILVITGGPGTGKTTVVAHLLRLMLRLDPRIIAQEDFVICAPTGRAAARLSGSIAGTAAKIEDDPLIRDNLSALAGRTVHGVLGYDPRTGGFLRGPSNPIDCRMIVVDEASMLDISIFNTLLSAIRKETTLVLLGDQNQLASVDAGAVLGDMTAPFVNAGRRGRITEPVMAIPSLDEKTHERLCRIIGEPVDKAIICGEGEKNLMTGRLVVLTKSFRSQQDISAVAHRINIQEPAEGGAGFVHRAVADLFDNKENRTWPAADGGVLRTPTADIACWEKEWIQTFFGEPYVKAASCVKEFLDAGDADGTYQGRPLELTTLASRPEVKNALRRLFQFLDASAVLCIVRKGEAGSETANLLADAMLRPLIDPECRERFFNGCAVMMMRNNRQRELWNGDRGIGLAARGRRYFVAQRHDRFDFFPLSELEGLELSFAMTVHKSQGCEFGNVLAVLPRDKNHPLLTKEIIYTALTRAKTRAVVLGSGDVLDAAIGRKVIRRSGVVAR